jgi:hypothetical protein
MSKADRVRNMPTRMRWDFQSKTGNEKPLF